MAKSLKRIIKLARDDGRYSWDAYVFVQEALVYAQLELGMGRPRPFGTEGDTGSATEPSDEAHLTGQELCQAIRMYAADRFGLMAKVVLHSWNVKSTRDFGEIVYKLIEVGEMTKSDTDQLEDFDDVYDFEDAFCRQYKITMASDDS